MASEDRSLGNVLVIGGCGLLGHHIIQKLIESKSTDKIVVMDINTERNQIENVENVTGSITSPEDVTKALQEHSPRVVFHTVSPDPLSENRKRFYRINIKGTQCRGLSTHWRLESCVFEIRKSARL